MSEDFLSKLIAFLKEERQKVDRAIATLEELVESESKLQVDLGAIAHTRGRHSMGLEERKQVSERMKRYWAGRRVAK